MLSGHVIDSLDERFGLVWVSGDGSETYVKCPFCPEMFGSEDTKGHLALNFMKNVGHCVRCDAGIRDLARWLKKKYNYVVPIFSLPSLSTLSSILKKKKEKAVLKRQNIALPKGTKPLPYHKWGSGDFTKSLIKKRISAEDGEDYRICYCREGRFENYVIFPFYEHDPETVVYWQGRAIYPTQEFRKINPSKSLVSLGKSCWLYGYHLVEEGGVIYVTEGNLDCISTNRFLKRRLGDGHFAVSIQGTALSFPAEDEHTENSQFGKIVAKNPSKVVILLDSDARKKADALGNLLSLCGIDVSVARLQKGDPNESDDDELLSAITPKSRLDLLEEDLLILPKFS